VRSRPSSDQARAYAGIVSWAILLGDEEVSNKKLLLTDQSGKGGVQALTSRFLALKDPDGEQRDGKSRIAITQAAFDAISATLPLGSVGYENATNEHGKRLIGWTRRRWTGSGRCEGRASRLSTVSCVSRGRRRLPLDAGKTKLPLGAG
jgi:hypothetical protein